jgi:hypothetical protein
MEVIELMQEELVLRMDLFRRIEKALVFMKEKVMRSAIDDVHDAEAKAGGGGQGGGRRSGIKAKLRRHNSTSAMGALFHQLDTNNDGVLSRDELRDGLNQFGSVVSEKDLTLLFKSIDREVTGTISIKNMEQMLVETRNAVKADSDSMWEGYDEVMRVRSMRSMRGNGHTAGTMNHLSNRSLGGSSGESGQTQGVESFSGSSVGRSRDGPTEPGGSIRQFEITGGGGGGGGGGGDGWGGAETKENRYLQEVGIPRGISAHGRKSRDVDETGEPGETGEDDRSMAAMAGSRVALEIAV